MAAAAPEDLASAFDVSTFDDEPLPVVLAPVGESRSLGDLVERIAAHRSEIGARLLRHGGVLFRGFHVHGAADFAEAIDALATGSALDYVGGDSPRTKLHRSVYTSTEAPAAVKIPLHNELSFVRDHPRHIFFHCEVAPNARGETILGDGRRIYEKLDPAVRERFLARKVRYESCYYGRSWLMETVNRFQPSHKSWRQVFETESPERVAELCAANDFELDWHDDNWLRIRQTRPVAKQHPETGETVWFCQPHLYDFNPRLLGGWRWAAAKLFYARKHTRLHEVHYGDGSPIPRDELYHLMDTLDACTVAFPWQRGDVLVLDNVLSMHGRATFDGPRRILAAMTG